MALRISDAEASELMMVSKAGRNCSLFDFIRIFETRKINKPNLHTGLVEFFILSEPFTHFAPFGHHQGALIAEMAEPQFVHIIDESWGQDLLDRRVVCHCSC